MERGGFPVTSDAAATRWHFRPSARQAPLEIDDFQVLQRVRSLSADPQALQDASFRRRYERGWLTAEGAAERVMSERGEVLGARAGSALAALTLPAITLLFVGGTAVQAFGLALVLAMAGALTLLWKGADVVPRIAILETIAIAALVSGRLGLGTALFVALYVPALVMMGAAMIGARLGIVVAKLAYARLRQRMLSAAGEGRGARPQDAVAA